MKKDYTIVVLISGRGSNLQSLVKNQAGYRISAVLSDNPDAKGLLFAAENSIPTHAFPRSAYSSLKEQKEAIYNQVRALNPDLVVLAGFMQIVAPHFVKEFEGKIVNIHPSLLPLLPGLHTHQRAIEEKHTAHGCTVHFVDSGVDTGAIIAQAKVAIKPGDTEATLSARVLEREHIIFPWAIRSLATGSIRYGQGRAHLNASAQLEAEELGFILPL